MKHLLMIAALLLTVATAGAQDFNGRQIKQEQAINAAHSRNAVSNNEYQKLLREQQIIKDAITDAAADGTWTPREKNAVNGKLERAAKRLRRYKTNNEVY